MARASGPSLSVLASIRIGHLADSVKNEELIEDFSRYGAIVDFYRPMNLAKRKPSPFAFVRYGNQDEADLAINEMNETHYRDSKISVANANAQDSFFTQDTGFITNQLFDTPKVIVDNFDPSMPESHYDMKRREALSHAERVFTLRVDDVPATMTKEELETVFSEFGEISSIYLPIDLKSHRHRGFAFVRFLRENSMKEAAKHIHHTCIGEGRPVVISIPYQREYLSQDESHNLGGSPIKQKQRK